MTMVGSVTHTEKMGSDQAKQLSKLDYVKTRIKQFYRKENLL